MILKKWRLGANPQNGTLTLTEDRVLRREPSAQVFALPSTGHADAITTICLATFDYSQGVKTHLSLRMLFLDREDRVIGTGRLRSEPKASMLWPAESFAPLARVGILTTSERYGSARLLEDAYPGAAPKFMLWSWRRR